MRIGLTGGIASGKNFVARLFEEKGCHVLDADEVSRLVMSEGGTAYDAIVAAFGEDIAADRAKLRQLVIADADKRKLLESIVHPAIAQYYNKWAGEVKGKDDKAILIYHAPLLLEADTAKNYDAVVLVWCSPETQLARLKSRGYPPYEDALKLMAAQMPYEEKLKYADFVINNDSDEENASNEVDRVYKLLEIMRHTNRLSLRA